MATFTQSAKFLGEVNRRAGLAVKAAAMVLVGNIQALLTNGGGGSGRRYDFYKGNLYPLDANVRFFTRGGKVYPYPEPAGGWKVRGRVHQASAPGQSPRLLTGALARGVTHRLAIDSTGPLAQVGPSGPSVKYARALEDRMGRPAWARTMTKSWDQLQTVFARTYARAA